MFNDIKKYLNNPNISFDPEILEQILRIKEDAIARNDEKSSNEAWCYEQIYEIQKEYFNAFNFCIEKKYKEAWLDLDSVDIKLCILRDNFEFGDEYYLNYIQSTIRNIQKFFPYKFFISRESIIKKSKCNICDKEIKVRGGCKHVPGKLYFGKLCLRLIIEFEFVAFAVVENPVDKYCVLESDDIEYGFSNVDDLIDAVKTPYCKWSLREESVVMTKYKKIGVNDKCPCNSGRKYKKCCRGTENEKMPHLVIVLQKES